MSTEDRHHFLVGPNSEIISHLFLFRFTQCPHKGTTKCQKKKNQKKKQEPKKTHAFYIRLHEQQHNMHRICAASPSLLRRIVSFAFHVLPLHCFFDAHGPQGPLVFPHRPLRSIVPARLLASALPRIIIARQQYQLIWHAMREFVEKNAQRVPQGEAYQNARKDVFFCPGPSLCLSSAYPLPRLFRRFGRT